MTPSSFDIPLHDIKPLMEVPDSSLTFTMIIVIMGAFILMGTLYIVYNYLRTYKSVNRRKEHFKALKKVNFSDPKTAAYSITRHGRIFADDSERLHEAFVHLSDKLEQYKYKKEVEAIDQESKSYYKIYLEMIDV